MDTIHQVIQTIDQIACEVYDEGDKKNALYLAGVVRGLEGALGIISGALTVNKFVSDLTAGLDKRGKAVV